MLRYSIFVSIIWLFFGCKKEEVPFFEAKPGIAFYINQGEQDSLSYSFAYGLDVKERDTLFLKMRVMGSAIDSPRKIKIVPAEGTTARSGIDYILPDMSLPAGQLSVEYPLVVLNSPEMKQKEFVLIADVVSTEDLQVGATGWDITETSRAMTRMTVKISNILSRPAYWDYTEWYFGRFSEIRYRFMVQVLGITDFSAENLGITGTYNYPIALRKALVEYEAVHGKPLEDEHGIVTF